MTRFDLSAGLTGHLRARGGRASTARALDAAIPDPGLTTLASLSPQMTYADIAIEATTDAANVQARLDDPAGLGYIVGLIPAVAASLAVPNLRYPVAAPTGAVGHLAPGPGPTPGLHLAPAASVLFESDPLYNLARFDADDLWSVEVWVRTLLVPGGPVAIVDKSDGTTWPLRLRLTASGTIEGSRSDGTHTPTVSSSEVVNDGDWHYVSLVKTAPNLSLQIDDTPAVTTTDTVTSTTVNSAALVLGGSAFEGDVADLGIFEVSLTAERRARHIAATLRTPVAA